MPDTASGWNHDDVVRLLARETEYAPVDVESAVLKLAALGWTQHQVRRGILTIARTGGIVTLDMLWRGAVLAGGDVDSFLDALVTPKERPDA